MVFLFEGVRAGAGSREVAVMDFLSLLNHDEVLIDLAARDTHGEDALQHASRACTGDVIAWLLQRGSSMTRFGHIPWRFHENPIQLAIVGGNVSAFETLLPYYTVIDEEDTYGYTMLDYAARQGRDEIVRQLLKAGSEETWPEFDFMSAPEALAGRNCGSSEPDDKFVTVGWTAESYLKYLMVLQDIGKIEIRSDTDSNGFDVVDIYWNAMEYLG